MVFRITNKLAKKIKEKPDSALPVHENPFLDWSADHFVAGKLHHMVLMHNPTAFSLYFHSKGVTNAATFLEMANGTIRDGLAMFAYELIYHTHIAPHFGEVRFSKVGNRKLSGIMAQLVWHAKFLVAHNRLSPTQLNNMPQCSLKEVWP
jgi:hypothetical protein